MSFSVKPQSTSRTFHRVITRVLNYICNILTDRTQMKSSLKMLLWVFFCYSFEPITTYHRANSNEWRALARTHHYIVCFMYAVLDSDDDSPDIVKVAAMYLAQCNFYAAHTHTHTVYSWCSSSSFSLYLVYMRTMQSQTRCHMHRVFVSWANARARAILRLLWRCVALFPLHRDLQLSVRFCFVLLHCSLYCRS